MLILVVLPQEIVIICYQSGCQCWGRPTLSYVDLINARYYVRRSQFLKHSKSSYARYYVRRLTPGITYASVSFSNIPKRPVLRTYYVRQFLVSETFQIELRPVLRTSTYARYYVRRSQFLKHSITPGIAYVLRTPVLSFLNIT